jgi:predicted nucleic acid-binding protein
VIIFDTSFLVVLLHPTSPPAKDRENKPVAQFRERVAYLAQTMDNSGEPIGVPTPAMAELLVGAGEGRRQYVSILSRASRFQIIPFDSRAAIEASELIALMKKRKQPWGTWAKVKFDIQIASIAKAEAATLIYADDVDIENLAKLLKIPCKRICDLPIPPPPVPQDQTEWNDAPVGAQLMLLKDAPAEQPLFPSEAEQGVPANKTEVSSDESKPESAKDAAGPGPKTADEHQADPAHPAPVRGSDERRTEGEAAGKESTEEAR